MATNIVTVEFEEGGYETKAILCASGEIDVQIETYGTSTWYSLAEWESLVARAGVAITYLRAEQGPLEEPVEEARS